MNIPEKTSQKIKNMGIVCALLVVTIHIGWPNDDICLTWFIHELIRNGIARIAVPFFFVTSGFFIAAHFDDEKWWRNEIRKRIATLLVPFFVWSLIYFASMVASGVIADIIAHRPFRTSVFFGVGKWMHILGLELDRFPALTPLWYVRCLFIFMLATPLFKWVVDRFKISWLILAFLISVMFSTLLAGKGIPFLNRFFKYSWSLPGMFYFSVGIYLQRFHISFSSKRIALICAVCGFAILLIRTCFHAIGMTFPFDIECLISPLLLYATWYVMTPAKLPQWFTSCSFSVFLLHCIFLWYTDILFNNIPMEIQRAKIISYIFATVGSIALTNVMRKFLPKTTSFLFAGRT